MKKTFNNLDALVVLMNNVKDFEIAKQQQWYRIPVRHAPNIIKTGACQFIAFYHTKIFTKDRYTIQWFARIHNVSIVQRPQLFPLEPLNSKSKKNYYKISFGSIQRLPQTILSNRPRRVLFIPTTSQQLFSANNINQIFQFSFLEAKMIVLLNHASIKSEREYKVTFNTPRRKYALLDFAVFCKNTNINIECDGATYHNSNSAIEKDKNRNNLLESVGWKVLRFTTNEVFHHPDETLRIIKKTIHHCGGLHPSNHQ